MKGRTSDSYPPDGGHEFNSRPRYKKQKQEKYPAFLDMGYTVYILYSKTFKKTYVGYTSNIEARLYSHNSIKNKGWTKRYQPWEVIYTEEYNEKAEASKREKQLKTGGGRDFIKKIIAS